MVYLLVFFFGFAITYLFTPLAGKLSFFLKAVDLPDERRIHTNPTPRLGGLAIYLSFFFSLLIGVFYLISQGKGHLVKGRELWVIFLGATVALLIGLSDDTKTLKPQEKFLGQLVAASILVFFGLSIDIINLPFVGVVSPGYLGIPLTLIWVAAFMNVVNLIDGLDGLAAGVSAIASLTFFVYAFRTGHVSTGLLCLALAGSCLGFLRHNFYPARIFMGDTGSLLVGFLLAAITVQGVVKTLAATAFLLPLVIMGVPIFDTLLAILRRIKNRRPISEPDTDHIHHRFLNKGFSQRRTVFFIYLWTSIFSITGLSLRFAPRQVVWGSAVALLIVSLSVAYFLGVFDVFFERAKKV